MTRIDLGAPSRPADTARLTFRSWRIEDEDLALSLWGDPSVTALTSARGTLTHDEVRERLALELQLERDHGIQYWPTFLRATGELAGCCGLRPYDLARSFLELGFHLRSAHWGQGLATEAARSAIEHAFTHRAASALFAGHHPKNRSSRRALEKLGFRYTHDEHYPPTGLEHPSYLLTRVQSVWNTTGRPADSD